MAEATLMQVPSSSASLLMPPWSTHHHIPFAMFHWRAEPRHRSATFELSSLYGLLPTACHRLATLDVYTRKGITRRNGVQTTLDQGFHLLQSNAKPMPGSASQFGLSLFRPLVPLACRTSDRLPSTRIHFLSWLFMIFHPSVPVVLLLRAAVMGVLVCALPQMLPPSLGNTDNFANAKEAVRWSSGVSMPL